MGPDGHGHATRSPPSSAIPWRSVAAHVRKRAPQQFTGKFNHKMAVSSKDFRGVVFFSNDDRYCLRLLTLKVLARLLRTDQLANG